jgi:hypothetical protein
MVPDASDRLVDPSSLPQDVPAYDVTAADDMLDPKSNATAQHLDQMITTADKMHHQHVIDKMNASSAGSQATPTPDYWFMNDASGQTQAPLPDGYATFGNDQVITPGDDPASYSPASKPGDDAALLEEFEHNKAITHNNYGHMRVVEPLSEQNKHKNIQPQNISASKSSNQPVTTITDPAIINLALANKDNWSVATIAHQAEEAKKKQPPQDEVIISLH